MTHSKFSLPRHDPFTAKPGFFLAQVVGESINRRIPNGSWCLFREPDSMDYNFKPLTPDLDSGNVFRVVGEFAGIICKQKTKSGEN